MTNSGMFSIHMSFKMACLITPGESQPTCVMITSRVPREDAEVHRQVKCAAGCRMEFPLVPWNQPSWTEDWAILHAGILQTMPPAIPASVPSHPGAVMGTAVPDPPELFLSDLLPWSSLWEGGDVWQRYLEFSLQSGLDFMLTSLVIEPQLLTSLTFPASLFRISTRQKQTTSSSSNPRQPVPSSRVVFSWRGRAAQAGSLCVHPFAE